MTEAQILDGADERIRNYRMAELLVEVTDKRGNSSAAGPGRGATDVARILFGVPFLSALSASKSTSLDALPTSMPALR